GRFRRVGFSGSGGGGGASGQSSWTRWGPPSPISPRSVEPNEHMVVESPLIRGVSRKRPSRMKGGEPLQAQTGASEGQADSDKDSDKRFDIYSSFVGEYLQASGEAISLDPNGVPIQENAPRAPGSERQGTSEKQNT
ncbi:unnamed protein product, partial [Discosporangium mesarthrocarpum]